MMGQFRPKSKKAALNDQALELETALDSVLRSLNLDNQDIVYIKEPLYSAHFPRLYQRILHLFLLNPELRTHTKGKDLRDALLKCWEILFSQRFNDPPKRLQNEKELNQELQVFHFYLGVPNLKKQQKVKGLLNSSEKTQRLDSPQITVASRKGAKGN